MKYLETAKVLKNSKIAPEHCRLTLKAPKIAKEAIPGQFVMVKGWTSTDPLLRRPISFNRINKKKGTIELLFRVIGKGTQILAKLETGDELDLVGPLGNGFEEFAVKKNAILVGGGAGIAPLLALAESIISKDVKVYALIGANSKESVLIKKDFAELGCKVLVSTDNGSAGKKGKATDLLVDLLKSGLSLYATQAFACGPRPMIKTLMEIAGKFKVPVQVSLEEWMACGIGACFGCTVKTRKGNKKVCSDGPVFNIEEIAW